VSPPLLPDEVREYRVIRRKIPRNKAPGLHGGTTHGKPKTEWKVGIQRQRGRVTGSAPRSVGTPPLRVEGLRADSAKRWEEVSLMERTEGTKPSAPSQAMTKPEAKTEGQPLKGVEESPTSEPRHAYIYQKIVYPEGRSVVVPVYKEVLTAEGQVIRIPVKNIGSDGALGAREKCLPRPAEDRPQTQSTPQGGSQVKEDKPSE
jgi:hypothetical protein